MINLKRVSIIISLLIILGIVFGGCGGDSGFIKADATKLGINFSFEFPASYTGYDPQIFEDTEGDPAITILYRDPENNLPKADKQIYVRPCDPLAERPDASAWMEEHIALLERSDSRYELIERSSIVIAGIEGEFAGYYSSVIGNLLNSVYTVNWDAYIDYQGYIWKIAVIAVPELEDEARADFERLVSSFEFLN